METTLARCSDLLWDYLLFEVLPPEYLKMGGFHNTQMNLSFFSSRFASVLAWYWKWKFSAFLGIDMPKNSWLFDSVQ
jgi:hypothetical protein